jgi:hypothetical protein
MKGQDIVILLKLVSLQEQADLSQISENLDASEDPYSVRNLGAALGISKTEVSASINRSLDSGLATKDRQHNRVKPNRRGLCDLLTSGLKFVFPAKLGAPQRGVPTAFAAPMLEGQLISAGEDVYVWPHALGKVRGVAVPPLFKSVPKAVEGDEQLYAFLALIDAIRLGRQRDANLASELLRERLLK